MAMAMVDRPLLAVSAVSTALACQGVAYGFLAHCRCRASQVQERAPPFTQAVTSNAAVPLGRLAPLAASNAAVPLDLALLAGASELQVALAHRR